MLRRGGRGQALILTCYDNMRDLYPSFLTPSFPVCWFTTCGASLLAGLCEICYRSSMPATIDLRQMSTTEKLRLMENLWLDLSGKEVLSPDWHGDVLAERDRLIASGEEKFVDWETAKHRLREELE